MNDSGHNRKSENIYSYGHRGIGENVDKADNLKNSLIDKKLIKQNAMHSYQKWEAIFQVIKMGSKHLKFTIKTIINK